MTTTLTRSKTALKVHPAAEIFPMLNAEELDALALDIKANGLQQPIVMWEGLLLDGRNRLAACAICGVEPSFKQYEGNSPVTFVISANIKRRQLDASQRACVAVELEPMFAVEAKKKKEEAGKKYGRGQKVVADLRQPIGVKASNQAAEVVSVSPRMVQYAKEIKVKNPEAFERIKAGTVKVSEVQQEMKKEKREGYLKSQRQAIENGGVASVTGLFDVIVCDPPWAYGREYDPDGSRVSSPYPEMKQSDLLKIKIPSSKDCVLFMWTTHAFIWDAKELLDEYGFEYKANLVWNKQKMGMGARLRMQCEFCLIGIKGTPLWDNKTHRDIIEEPRREHSRKPESFYKLVEEITIGTRLEFFSRKSRKGWSVYGNETQKF